MSKPFLIFSKTLLGFLKEFQKYFIKKRKG